MEVNVRFAGEAGQGLQTAADMLGRVITRSGHHAYCYTDVESRIRGGLNFSHVRCSTDRRWGVTETVDILVALSERALTAFGPQVSQHGAVISAKGWDHPQRVPLDVAEMARKAGSLKVETTVSTAFLLTLLGIDTGILKELIRQKWGKDQKLLEWNLAALESGHQAALDWGQGKHFLMLGEPEKADRLWIAGHEAVALGAVAGGLTFLSSYPMSPATGILTSVALWAEKTETVVVQAEDEIASINMATAASYAGARSMVSTSGGGFCLMTEGVSLLGMIETPLVIAIGMRPGPATGLPTRTAQGDLHLVLNAGHGYFPRVVVAPHGIQDCFEMTAKAFDIAEKYQVPVFVLTDQLVLDSWINVDAFGVDHLPKERYLVAPEQLEGIEEYKRYALTDSGISPMAAPGASRHTVVVDSDEHDEWGHMTERGEIASAMAEKRMRKERTLREAIMPAEVDGEVDGNPLIITWGSTYRTVSEAVHILREQGHSLAHMNIRWLWPAPEAEWAAIMDKASSVIVIENNVNGELYTLLRCVMGRKADHLINRTDGRPFTVEQMVKDISRSLS